MYQHSHALQHPHSMAVAHSPHPNQPISQPPQHPAVAHLSHQQHQLQVNNQHLSQQQRAVVAPSPNHNPAAPPTLPPSMPQQMHRYPQTQMPQQQIHPGQHQHQTHPIHSQAPQGHPMSLPTSQRIHETLSEIQSNFDTILQENQALKAQSNQHREELDLQINQQIEEIQTMRRYLADLERLHHEQKARYEHEIANLRRELETRMPSNIPPQSEIRPALNTPHSRGPILPSPGPNTSQGFPDVPPPILGSSTGSGATGAFGPLIGSQGNHEHRLPTHTPGPMTPVANGLNGPPQNMPILNTPGQNQQPIDSLGPPSKRLRGDEGSHSLPQQQTGYREQQMPQGPPLSKQKILPGKHGLNDDGYRQPMYAQDQMSQNQGLQHQRSMQQPPQTQQNIIQRQPARRLPSSGTCDLESAPQSWKREYDGWGVIYNMNNPTIQRSMIKVELEGAVEHDSVVCCVRFSNDGRFLATGCNYLTRVVDVATRQIVCILEKRSEEPDYVRSICFSPDSKLIVTGHEDRVIRVWDIAQRTVQFELTGHTEDIYSLDWSRDGRVIVSGSGDNTVKIWDVEKRSLMLTLRNESDVTYVPEPLNPNTPNMQQTTLGVTSVAIRGLDCRVIAVGSLDKMVRIWDIRTGKLLERFEGHRDSVYSVAFSPDGQSIVSGSLDGTLIVWDLSPITSNYLAKQLNDPSLDDHRTVVTTNCRQCFSGHRDFVLSVGYAGTNATLGRVDSRGQPVSAQTDGLAEVEWVVSASKDRSVVFWDARAVPPVNQQQTQSHPEALQKQAAMFSLQGHKNSVISVSLAPVGGLFATGSGDNTARIWRASAEGAVMPAGPQPRSIPVPLSPVNRDEEMTNAEYRKQEPSMSRVSPPKEITSSRADHAMSISSIQEPSAVQDAQVKNGEPLEQRDPSPVKAEQPR